LSLIIRSPGHNFLYSARKGFIKQVLLMCCCTFHGFGPLACSDTGLTSGSMSLFLLSWYDSLDEGSANRKVSTYTGKRRHKSMPRAGLEPTTPVFERSKAIRVLDRAATGADSVTVQLASVMSIWSILGRINSIQLHYLLCIASNRSRDSSVGIALGYGLDDRGSRVRFPERAGNFSLHHRVQTGSGAHPASYPMGNRGSFPGSKAAGAWSWPLTSIYCRG
jgi:hypothetical protein